VKNPDLRLVSSDLAQPLAERETPERDRKQLREYRCNEIYPPKNQR